MKAADTHYLKKTKKTTVVSINAQPLIKVLS